ncbi:MAG: OmpA family protein [Bacteroidetes bacterium]|nr:MAG: OmpA family protein [Bacteroidota bacterium]
MSYRYLLFIFCFASIQGFAKSKFERQIFRDSVKQIPLAILKGSFFAKEDKQNVEVTLRVTDKISDKEQYYVYNPDLNTGKYMVFLPQNRTYEVAIMAKGYKSHIVQLYIPPATYMYQFDGELKLESLKAEEKTIGKKVTISKISHRVISLTEATAKSETDPYYDALAMLIDEIIERNDSAGLSRLIGNFTLSPSMPNVNSPDGEDFYYSDLIKNIDSALASGDANFINHLLEECSYKNSHYEGTEVSLDDTEYGKKLILSEQFYYNKDKWANTKEHELQLDNVLKQLEDLAGLVIEIKGYADADGKESHNKQLSERRARGVLEYLQNNNINTDKFIIKGLGSVNGLEKEAKKRRVDLKVYQLLDY